MARPDSKKLATQKKLCEHLAGINPETEAADGVPFEHDLTDRVHRGKAIFGNETEAPFLSLIESPREIDYTAAGDKTKRKLDTVLLLQGFVKTDQTVDDAYRLLAEVELRLSEIISTEQGVSKNPIYRLANLASDVLIGQGIVRPPTEKVSPTAFFYIPIVVKQTHDLSNPYGD